MSLTPVPGGPPAWAVVVAHYDAQGLVARHLLETVQTLQTQGAQVHFVSTGLGDAAAAQLAPHALVLRRPNTGYDFGSYRAGIQALGSLDGVQRLLLLNSSMVVADCARVIALMQARAGQADLLALTLSEEFQPHLQSFWLSFENPAILHSEAFVRWWAEMPSLSERGEVVAQLELGLSAHFARAGFRLAALHQPSRDDQFRAVLRAIDSGYLPVQPGADGPVLLDPAWARQLNPTTYAWDSVLDQLGVLKLELLQRNPHRINLAPLQDRLHSQPDLAALVHDAAGGHWSPSLPPPAP